MREPNVPPGPDRHLRIERGAGEQHSLKNVVERRIRAWLASQIGSSGTGSGEQVSHRRRFDEPSRWAIDADLPTGQKAIDGNHRSRNRALLEHALQRALPTSSPECPSRRFRMPYQSVMHLIAERRGRKRQTTGAIDSGRRSLGDQPGTVRLRHRRVDDRTENTGHECSNCDTTRTKMGAERNMMVLAKRSRPRNVFPSSPPSPDVRSS